MALSFEACIAGPFDLEMRVQATPYPYRQLEGHAGLACTSTPWCCAAGGAASSSTTTAWWTTCRTTDAFSGPYLGLGFTF